jgi:hypothetical protein
LAVESARDGFDVEVTRRVLPSDGGAVRTLNLKSTYQPAHTVTLVGSAGKPANANIDDAIQKVLDAQRAALEPKPTPSPQAATSGTVQPTVLPAAATQPPAPAKPAIAATPAAPQPTPKPAAPPPAAKPANTQPIAPTPTPTRR